MVEDADKQARELIEKVHAETEDRAEREASQIRRDAEMVADRLMTDAGREIEKIYSRLNQEVDSNTKQEYSRIMSEVELEADELRDKANKQAREIVDSMSEITSAPENLKELMSGLGREWN